MKVGYAALIGRPNVGKSTLINGLVNAKVSITSHKPQTTRATILGIDTDDQAQIIYVDTPGWQDKIPRALNRYMNRRVQETLLEADIILWVIDVMQWKLLDDMVGKLLDKIDKPIIFIMNKVDLIQNKSKILPMIQSFAQRFPFIHSFFPLSARSQAGLAELRQLIIELLPAGKLLFPEDEYTDKTENFMVAEIIREKLFRLTDQEIPYVLTVSIDELKKTNRCVKINATIWVEKEGQKAIVIGKQGSLLKKAGMDARRDMERLFENKVFLNLWVKVKDNWSDEENNLVELGYE